MRGAMSKKPIEIRYHFVCDGEADQPVEKHCVVQLDPDTLETRHPLKPAPPDWTRLEVKQCDMCPLDLSKHAYCPAALSFVEILQEFGEILSYRLVNATVTTGERTLTIRTTAQKALSSLVGLRMATCGCPILAKFKPMARFHLPFSSTEETVYRAAGAYLLAQYFLRRRGGKADWDLDGLSALYEEIHQVNVQLAERMRTIPTGDAHLNALVILDLFTLALPQSIDENLSEIEHLFGAYFE